MPPRRASAPRLIEWTGERAVPWAPDTPVIYEHYHRYFWARALARGRRVLDLGSGEGFGAALLSDVAESVVGIDVDRRTVEHSQLNYSAENLRFEVGSAADLSSFGDDSFDLVVAYEIVEHLREQEAMLAEIARVLSNDGLLVISTPDRRTYSEGNQDVNPFHVRELSSDEFCELLATQFPRVALFGQRTVTGSRITTVEHRQSGPQSGFQIERSGGIWREVGVVAPKYLIAVAGRSELPSLPADSSLSDYGLALMRDAERSRGEEVARQAEALATAERRAMELGDRLMTLTPELTQARAALSFAEAQVVEQARSRMALVKDQEARDLVAEEDARELRRVRESVTWHAFQNVRGKVYNALGGHGSRRAALLGASLRGLARAGRRGSGAARIAPNSVEPDSSPTAPTIVIPQFADPVASIVIAAHQGAGILAQCLRSIVDATDDVPYEVIVVDDCADTATKTLLNSVEGVRVVRNTENLGYLRSVNRGSAEARGRYLVQLNNDTEPQVGWLRRLVDRVESAPDIGVVAAKLIFPDGVLQEAGGIIWQDATGANYGRGGNKDDRAYAFVREVDYGSAAALLVRTDLWEHLGGYDDRYAPAYYEDTDLCFAARAAGFRVVFEPSAVVVHLEGASMGTDTSAGLKANQEINRHKFASKWEVELREQRAPLDPELHHLAADRSRRPYVLIIDHRLPSPDRDSGSLRTWHMVENLIDLGYRVVFVPDDFAAREPYASRLRRMGVELITGSTDLVALMSVLAAETTMVILSRPYVAARYMHLVHEVMPGTRVAYDTVDLHYVREARRAELEGNPDTTKAAGLRELEHALARSADVVLTVSSDEADQLAADAPGVRTAVVPNANAVWDVVPDRARREGVMFVGGFDHTPNVDAAVHLARHIMPLVWQQLPDVKLTIAGNQPPPDVVRLAGPNIHVTGWVEDLGPLLAQNVALVAPLRYGAGVKGKVTQSLAAGLPVVTSGLGAEGLGALHRQHLLIADDPAEFAALVVELVRDAQLWRSLSAAGQGLVRRVSSPEVQREALVQLLAR